MRKSGLVPVSKTRVYGSEPSTDIVEYHYLGLNSDEPIFRVQVPTPVAPANTAGRFDGFLRIFEDGGEFGFLLRKVHTHIVWYDSTGPSVGEDEGQQRSSSRGCRVGPFDAFDLPDDLYREWERQFLFGDGS